MKIRQVTDKDLELVTALEAACFPVAEAASKASLHQRIQTFPSSFLVMEEEGIIIGMINGCVTNQKTITDNLYEDAATHDPKGAYQSVFGLDVHPNHQHKGYAIQLMNALIDLARKEGRNGMILTCKEELIGFYEQFGYRNKGISASVHGGVTWYDMRLEWNT